MWLSSILAATAQEGPGRWVEPGSMTETLPVPAITVPAPRAIDRLVGGRRTRRVYRHWRGRDEDPAWVRPSLACLLAAAGVLYLWNLGASGMANGFYAVAVQAGTQSWKAMLFGSLDAGNAITVDKPAFSLWPMEIAGRLFGFNSWSMLVPQALEGVASVALVYAAVRRVTAPAFGLLAGFAMALAPVAVLMFRFNNPDAMLVLLLTGASYAVVRALQATRGGRWLAFAGLLVGLGFITKIAAAAADGRLSVLAAPPAAGWRRCWRHGRQQSGARAGLFRTTSPTRPHPTFASRPAEGRGTLPAGLVAGCGDGAAR